jgi:membrane dipeptidase
MENNLYSLFTENPAPPMVIVDAHQDLAWNMLSFGRDYTLSSAETRRREAGTSTPGYTGDTLLGWTEYQKGRVAVVFSTLFAAPARRRLGDWDMQTYITTAQASALYRAQVDAYYRLADEHAEEFRLIFTQGDLQSVLSNWELEEETVDEEPDEAGKSAQEAEAEAQRGHPVGLVMLMEGAEGVREPAELEEWWGLGVRIIGPAWAGTRFSGGTREPGPLTSEGYALLEAMAAFGFTLDISHMDEKAALQALDAYPGEVIASHANALALLKGADTNRHLSERVVRSLIERGGIIGVVPYNSFLETGWRQGDRREAVPLDRVVAQIDYICQIAGDARHAGIGSDFDGGFGLQSAPDGIDTIADLQKLVPLLSRRGYSESDVAAILGENWLALLRRALPESV